MSARSSRLATILLAQLEDFQVVPPDFTRPAYSPEYTPREVLKHDQRDLRVVQSPATKRKLEEWFAARHIPIRIVYAEWEDAVPIGKKGTITYQYFPTAQEPPTAWMIVHNLSHAIHEPHDPYKDSPYGSYSLMPDHDDPEYGSYPRKWGKHYNLMDVDPNRPPLYPTTKSYQLGKLDDPGEAFHELFTQWVVKGKIVLNPRNSTLESQLAQEFRSEVDELAKMGAVIYND